MYPHEEAAPSVRCACGQGSCPTYGWPWRKLSAGRPRRVRAEHQGAPHVAVGADLTDGDIAVTTILHPPQSVTSQRGPGACASGAIATTYYYIVPSSPNASLKFLTSSSQRYRSGTVRIRGGPPPLSKDILISHFHGFMDLIAIKCMKCARRTAIIGQHNISPGMRSGRTMPHQR